MEDKDIPEKLNDVFSSDFTADYAQKIPSGYDLYW